MCADIHASIMFLSTVDLAPITRESLRQLREEREELRRQEEAARHRAHVINVTREVYQRVTTMASITEKSQYTYPIEIMNVPLMYDVLLELRILFPDCTVYCMTTPWEGGEDTVIDDAALQSDAVLQMTDKLQVVVDWS